MLKRDMDNPTAFVKKIKTDCNIFDLQGIGRIEDCYTCAFEAIDMENDPIDSYKMVLSERDIRPKIILANELGTDFYLFQRYKASKNRDKIALTKLSFNENNNIIYEIQKCSTPNQFIKWWSKKSCYKQFKPYGTKMKSKIESSYFDQLLEQHNFSWGLNVDGFTVDLENNTNNITSIIEFKISTDELITDYDPSKYIKSDKNAWGGLLNIANAINVPLFLFTFSRVNADSEKVGLAEIIGINENGLMYKDDIGPTNNIITDSSSVIDWMEDHINCFSRN